MILVNDVFTYTESIIIEVDLNINDWFTIFNYDVMSMGKCVTSYRVNLSYEHPVDIFYFLRSSTNTVPSLADAPTLSPRLFQHTSKMPPVPL